MSGAVLAAAYAAGPLAVPKPKRDYVKDHARRTLRKAGLTEEQAAKFVKNYEAEKDLPLSELSRKIPRGLSLVEMLYRSFVWDGTPEGFGYWNSVVTSLGGRAAR